MNKQVIIEGVVFDSDNDSFIFDFKHDSEKDIVRLASDGPYQIRDYEPCTYYGYVFEDKIDPKIKKQFIDLIKYPTQRIQQSDLNRFVLKSVAALDKKVSLPKYDVIVRPQSSSDLNVKIVREIYNRSLAGSITEIELVKDLPSKMDFNYDLYIDDLKRKTGVTQQNIDDSVKAIEKMMDGLKHLDYVKIGTYVKAKYRAYLKNFFRFKDESARKTYEALQGANVLMIDDVSTTRATLQYALNTIRCVNDSCNITMFCLLGNKIR